MSDLGARRPNAPSIETWVAPEQVREVLGGDATDVELLKHNPLNAVTGGIWRVRAGASSAICKVVTDGTAAGGDGEAGDSPSHWQASADPHHFNYWRREVEVYVDDLPARFRDDGVDAPRSLRLDDRGATVVLWLEDVDGSMADTWDVPTFAAFARSLGRAQGRLAATRHEWERPWLSREYLRRYSESKPVDEAMLGDDERWRHPRIERHLGHLRDRLRRLHRDRDRLYALAGACPRTLCHLDVWPANLARRSADGSFVLFDWSFSGDGALGEDIANLVPDAIFDLMRPAAMLPALAAAAEAAYVAGVREGGWDGDERWTRLGIRAAAVKYHWLVSPLLRDADRDDAHAYGGVAAEPDEIYAARAAGLELLCDWADEADALAAELDLNAGTR